MEVVCFSVDVLTNDRILKFCTYIEDMYFQCTDLKVNTEVNSQMQNSPQNLQNTSLLGSDLDRGVEAEG